MAITLPDARELSDKVLEALRLRPCEAVNWAFPKPRWLTFLASVGKPLPLVVRLRPGRPCWPAARPQRTPCRHGPSAHRRPGPAHPGVAHDPPTRRVGHSRPPVDTPGRRRPHPPAVSDRRTSTDRRLVLATLGLHAQAAAPPQPRPEPRGGTRMAGGDLSGHRATCGGGRRHDLLGR